ncbi:hypothetical protein GCM10027073_36980 [Streptomyces chlorus]
MTAAGPTPAALEATCAWSGTSAWLAERVTLRQPADLDKPDLDLRLGVPAAAVSPAARTVTLADGTELAYDVLILGRKLSGTDKTKSTAATPSTRANRGWARFPRRRPSATTSSATGNRQPATGTRVCAPPGPRHKARVRGAQGVL